MGFLDRVKDVVRPAFPRITSRVRRAGRAAPSSGLSPEGAKTSAAGPVIAWSGVGQPKWTPRRYENFAEEGFRKNVIAYRCVMQIATACSSVPWLLYDDGNNELDRHPLLDLLEHPNPLQDGVAFMESVYADLEIAGNAYIEAVRPREDCPPAELYVLRPDRMKVIPGATGLPEGYQYNVNGQVTRWQADPVTGASDILHLKRFHPLDDWYGMAPMEAALLSIDQHNMAGNWNQALLGQGARPSGALVYAPKDGPATLTDEQVRRLREEMGMLYQGDRNAGRPMILEGGLDWKEMSLSPKDMDWLAGRNNAARDIALAFGVPAQLVGIPDAQTYSNMAEARMAFYEETVLPNLTRVSAAFDHWLCPMYREPVWLDFDEDCISALTDKRQAQWDKIRNADFLTRNEMREAAGYAPVADGDGDDDTESYFSAPADALAGAAKFSPDQPRVPAGNSDGGQWTSGEADGEDILDTVAVSTAGNAIGNFFQWASGISEAHAQGIEEDETRGAEEGNLTAEARTAAYGAARDTLRQLDPNNRELESLTGPNWVPSQNDLDQINQAIADASRQRILDFAMPEGSPVGQLGKGPDVRVLPGGLSAAQQDFEYLIPGATAAAVSGYDGIMMDLPSGGRIGLRPISDSGPPSLDINVPGVTFQKIHYP